MSDFDEATDVGALVTRIDCLIAEIERLRAKVDELDELCDALGELVEAERQLIVDLRELLDEEYPGWDHTIAGLPLAERVELYAAEPMEASDGGTILYRGIREIKRLHAELARHWRDMVR